MLVEPGVAVGRGDPLGLAPPQQRVDDRVRGAERLQAPGPRVGHVDAGPVQQVPHLGRVAQVDVRGAPHEVADLGVPGRPSRRGC